MQESKCVDNLTNLFANVLNKGRFKRAKERGIIIVFGGCIKTCFRLMFELQLIAGVATSRFWHDILPLPRARAFPCSVIQSGALHPSSVTSWHWLQPMSQCRLLVWNGRTIHILVIVTTPAYHNPQHLTTQSEAYCYKLTPLNPVIAIEIDNPTGSFTWYAHPKPPKHHTTSHVLSPTHQK